MKEQDIRYDIIRFFYDGSREVRSTGLTLEDAQAHCSDPRTAKDGEYFDGYSESGNFKNREAFI